MQFYRKKEVLQILHNSVTGAINARTEGALRISQFNHHHSTPHFIDRETEVMRGKAYTGGHRERERETAKQEPRAPDKSVWSSFHQTTLPGWYFDTKMVIQVDLAAECRGKETIVQETVKLILWMSEWRDYIK